MTASPRHPLGRRAEDWLCPDCGVGKSDFEMIAIG
jgi:rubredoxin